MTLRRLLLASLLLVLEPASTSAQAVQTYLYDVNGRLVGVTTARASGDSTASYYAYDDADNRLGHAALPLSPSPVADTLAFPYTLVPSQKLTSANGQYTLGLEPSGDLVLRNLAGSALWSSCTAEGRTLYARINSSGVLTLYDTLSNPIWTAGPTGNPGAELILQNSGVAVLKTAGGATLWTSGTPCA